MRRVALITLAGLVLLGGLLAGCGAHAHTRRLLRVTSASPFVSTRIGSFGSPTVGEVFTTTNGTWTNNPTSFAYQWQDCNGTCTNISGATSSSYTLQSTDLGDTIDVIVTATNVGGSASQTSAQSGTVTSGSGSAPANTVEPYFTASTWDGSDNCDTGCAIEGQQLQVSTGTWSNSPTSYSYQWKDCTTTDGQPPTTGSCSNATGTGATSNTYTVGAGDTGSALVPIVTATNSSGSTSTSISGSCDQGLVPTGGIGSHQEFNYAAGCSPISAVAASTQAGEKYCTNSFTTCGFGDPFAGSAGVPPGTSLSTTGACAAWKNGGTVSTANTTINGCEITGVLNVNANNVTIENSDIDYSNDTSAAINVGASNTGFLLEHSAVHGTSATNPLSFAVSSTGSDGTAINVEGVYVYNVDRIITTAGIVQDSVCLGNGNFDAVGEHMECTYVGKGSTDYAIHDVLISSPDEDGAAAFYAQGDFGVLSNIEVENNLFADGSGPGPSYGGYCIDGGDTSGGGDGVSSGETITGNRMSRIFTTTCGGYGVYAFIPSFATRTGNIWDDTLASANSG